MKTKVLNTKRELENILRGAELSPDGRNVAKVGNSFICSYSCDASELQKRARHIDNALFSANRKINGGLAVQAAMAFIMENKKNANLLRGIVIRFASRYEETMSKHTSCYRGAYIGNKRLCDVKFSQSDYNYALDVLRIA